MFDKTVTCSCLFIADDLRWFHKLNWVLFSVRATTAIQVTGLFWTVLAPSRTAAENLNPITFHLHGTNSILFLVEIFMVAFPTRLLHFVYPITFSFTYAVFSVILHFTGVNSSTYPVQARIARNSQWWGCLRAWRRSPAAGGWGFVDKAPSRRRHGGLGVEPPGLENFAFFCKNNLILGLFWLKNNASKTWLRNWQCKQD